MHVVIIGAGIGGLTAAVALRRAGVDVTVLEQTNRAVEIGAGIGLGPNAVGALTNLGIAAKLQNKVSEPSRTTRRRWRDGAELFGAPLARTVDQYGYPFWFAHRSDLHSALLDTALESEGLGTPVQIRSGTRVESIESSTGRVRTTDGELCSGDVTIAADGYRSRIRRELFDGAEPTYTGHSGFRTQVDAAPLLEDRELAEFVVRNGFESWLGPGAHVVHCPFRQGSVINVTACIEAPQISTGATSVPVSAEETLSYLEGWYPPLRRLIEAGNGVVRYDVYLQPPMSSWVTGRVALLGDACHPMFPYLGQGAAQAIEDGQALGATLGHSDDPVEGLHRFERSRIERANRVQGLSGLNATTFHLPDGPEQRDRDRAVAEGRIDSDVSAWLWQYQDPDAAAAVLQSVPAQQRTQEN